MTHYPRLSTAGELCRNGWDPSDDTNAPGDGKDREITETSTYPLRLPRSLKEPVEKHSEGDGTSINQFVATAVAENMKRRGGKPPCTVDETKPKF